jgi:DNA-binding FadR family transcriptional regulator
MKPMNFKKAKQNRIFQDVVDQIQVEILDGRIAPGERLPAERELCEMFQTSRGTLREALRILEQKSLIDIRLGVNGGAYVKDANGELMAENLAMLIRSQTISLAHLAEFREGVEGSVAGLAAQRALSADIKILYSFLAKADHFRNSGTDGWNNFVRIDEKIHTEIARIAGNPLYVFILNSVHDNIQRYYDKFLSVGKEEMEENYRDLRLIIEAIKNAEVELASSRAIRHVRKFSRYMEQKKRKVIPIQ